MSTVLAIADALAEVHALGPALAQPKVLDKMRLTTKAQPFKRLPRRFILHIAVGAHAMQLQLAE